MHCCGSIGSKANKNTDTYAASESVLIDISVNMNAIEVTKDFDVALGGKQNTPALFHIRICILHTAGHMLMPHFRNLSFRVLGAICYPSS